MKTLILLAGLLLGAAVPMAVPAATAAAAQSPSFSVGNLHVQQYGDHGRAVILIPGLGSGAWVWKNTVAHLRSNHVVYAITLAGFDGTPPPAQKTGLMDQADASLLQLLKTRHINKPVLVGHSLGGTLAIRFATEHSDLISGVVAVDGLPIFPGMEKLSAAQREAGAARVQQGMAGATPAQFAQQQTQFMQVMGVLDPAEAKKYGAMQARSNPATVAEYMGEDLRTDLRQALPKISVPLLEISPYNQPDFEKVAAMSKQPLITENAKTAYYRQLLQGVPQLKVVSIAPSRHFVMLDQPQRFQSALDAFLARLGGS